MQKALEELEVDRRAPLESLIEELRLFPEWSSEEATCSLEGPTWEAALNFLFSLAELNSQDPLNVLEHPLTPKMGADWKPLEDLCNQKCVQDSETESWMNNLAILEDHSGITAADRFLFAETEHQPLQLPQPLRLWDFISTLSCHL